MAHPERFIHKERARGPAGRSEGAVGAVYDVIRHTALSAVGPILIRRPTGRQPQSFALKPEDMCQGKCITDKELYEEIDAIGNKNVSNLSKDFKDLSFKERLAKARLYANGDSTGPKPHEVWRYGWTHGLFEEYEKEAVLGPLYRAEEKEAEKTVRRAQYELARRWRAESTDVYNQLNYTTIQAGLMSAKAFGLAVTRAYFAMQATQTGIDFHRDCVKGSGEQCATFLFPMILGLLIPGPDDGPRYNITRHKDRLPVKGVQGHHFEQQAALEKALGKEQYHPDEDYSIPLNQKTEHVKTFSPQARQRQDPAFAQKLGTPEALGQAFVMLRIAGVPAEKAYELFLKHSGYLFEASRRPAYGPRRSK
jgi:hypothetical protein